MNKELKIYELIGKINQKKLDKVRSKKSQHYGSTYYRLAVDLENKSELKEILVFKKFLEKESIYQELEQLETKDYIGKRYSFHCQRKPGAGQVWRLINWEELINHEKN